MGFALTTQWEGQAREKLQVIGFDMGGTSTDVSRYAGSYEHVFESTTAGVAARLTGVLPVCNQSAFGIRDDHHSTPASAMWTSLLVAGCWGTVHYSTTSVLPIKPCAQLSPA